MTYFRFSGHIGLKPANLKGVSSRKNALSVHFFLHLRGSWSGGPRRPLLRRHKKRFGIWGQKQARKSNFVGKQRITVRKEAELRLTSTSELEISTDKERKIETYKWLTAAIRNGWATNCDKKGSVCDERGSMRPLEEVPFLRHWASPLYLANEI